MSCVSWQSALQQNSSVNGSTYPKQGPRKSMPKITSYASVSAMMTGVVIVVSARVPLAIVKLRWSLVLPRQFSVFPPAVTKVSPRIRSSLLHRRISELNDLPKMTEEAPLSIMAILGRLPSTSSWLPPVTSVAMEYLLFE